jgi:hypothetical protein
MLGIAKAALRTILTCAATAVALEAGAVEITTFDLREDKYFADPRPMLEGYARRRSTARTNRFCVLGVTEAGSHLAWIVWPQKRQLILWEGQDLRETAARRVLDMDRDVVKSERELRGSSYLVTRDWLEAIVSRCRSAGEEITVIRKP